MRLPVSEFSKLDLPTLERPRNATSGATVGGNCFTSAAEVTNWTLTFTFANGSKKARGARALRRHLL
jgi:hypothetical protein